MSEVDVKEPSPTQPDGWERWFRPRNFACGLAVLVFVSWWEVLLGLGTFALGDFDVFGYPLAHYHRESFWRGEIPLWNPHNNCGLPFLAQWNSLVLYPPSLFYVLFPLSWSLGVFCVLHLYAGGLGMYFLARHWTRHNAAAAVAGVAYAFSGLTQTALMWPNNSAALGCLPWILLLTEFGWQRGGRWLLGASLIGAMQMMTGAPEIILCTWLMALLNLCFRLSGQSWECPPVIGFGRFGGMVMLVSCLCAAQLLPFLELLSHSQRDTGYGGETWAAGPFVWGNYLVPLFRTITDSAGVHYQADQQWAVSTYAGILIVFLSLAGLWRIQERAVIGLAAIGFLSLVLAMGANGYIYGLLERVIPLGVMRYPAKFLLFVAVVLPLLAAFGLREILERRSLVPALAVTLAGWGITMLLARSLPVVGEDLSAVFTNGFIRLACLLLGAVFLFAFVHAGSDSIRQWLPALLILVAWMDLKTQQSHLTPTVDRRVYEEAMPILQELEPAPVHGTGRAALTTKAISELRRKSLPNISDTTVLHRLGIFDNVNLVDGLAKIDGIYSLYLADQQDVEARLTIGMDGLREPVADFLGVNQRPSATNIFHWLPRTNAMPFVTIGKAPVIADANAILEVMTTDRFRPRKEVFISGDIESVMDVHEDLAARVSDIELAPQRIRFKTFAMKRTLTVLSQANFTPWTARVNGELTPIVRANHAFQAIPVPVGESEVELVYEDKRFQLGGLISIVSLILVGLLWWKSRPQSGADPSAAT